MEDSSPDPLLSAVLPALLAAPDGLAIEAILRRLPPQEVSRRTLQRRLAEWSSAGVIRAQGIQKGRRYFAPNAPLRVAESPASAHASDDILVSDEGHEVRELVRRPVFRRQPVGYRREFLDDYQPNVSAYFSPAITNHLKALGRTPDGARPAGTYARDILNRLLIDLSWASSRLEGNTYSLLDTEQLIRNGRVPDGKDVKETQMILNHKAAIELLVDNAAEIGLDRFTLLNLHALLADNLLEDPRQAGRLRREPVGIAGSVYIPTAVPQLIEEQFTQLIQKAEAIRDPFERALFVMVHLPYLQPFIDVNKRTSRLAANVPLIQNNLVPLSFIDMPEQAYIDAVVGVYELNRVELLRDVFVWAYERSCRRYKTVRDSVPEPDLFRLAHRQALIEVVGSIVRDGLPSTAEQVGALAASLVDAPELPRFTQIAIEELENLHEGNIARFRLRPSEFRRWRRV